VVKLTARHALFVLGHVHAVGFKFGVGRVCSIDVCTFDDA
jgi:hypothetical protein